MPVRKIMYYAGSSLITGLISVNAFFIKGLVSTIDTTNDKVTEVHERVAILEVKVMELKNTIERIFEARKDSPVDYGELPKNDTMKTGGGDYAYLVNSCIRNRRALSSEVLFESDGKTIPRSFTHYR